MNSTSSYDVALMASRQLCELRNQAGAPNPVGLAVSGAGATPADARPARLQFGGWASPFTEHKDDRLTVDEDTTTWAPCSPPPAWKSPSPPPVTREGGLHVHTKAPRAACRAFLRGGHVTGGLGFSNYHVNTSPSFDGTGWGFTGGVGYDIRVGRDISLTPVVNYVYGGVGDVNEQGLGAAFTRWKQNVVEFGLGVTFH